MIRIGHLERPQRSSLAHRRHQLVHEQARLAILTNLFAVESANRPIRRQLLAALATVDEGWSNTWTARRHHLQSELPIA